MEGVPDEIKRRQVALFAKCDPAYGAGVANALHLDPAGHDGRELVVGGSSSTWCSHALHEFTNRRPDDPATQRPADQILIRHVALDVGFCSSSGSRDLTKLALGLVATKGTWGRCRSALTALSGLRMDENLPSYRGMDQQISYVTRSDESGHEPLERIETLLAPVLFCLPGRPAVITPIQHGFAKLLLSHSPQKSLLPAPSSNLFQERHFLSGSHAFNRFRRGTLILFYESKHPRSRGELVAIARVRRAYLKEISNLGPADLEQSVLRQTHCRKSGSLP